MFCDLKEKTALVTGASRGIGSFIAKKLASHGAFVYINYNSSDARAQKIVDEIVESGGQAELCKFDVSDYEAVLNSFSDIIQAKGNIHILVNNAGITKDALLMRMKEADWDNVININLKGVFNCSKAVVSSMLKQRFGRIINISSVVGSMGNAGQTNYAATKAGLEGFTKSMAREVASRGITVNAVAPGYIETEMTDVIPEKIKEELIKQIPLNRIGKPEEIANAVAFLASDEASYITGHVFHVNGGLLCD
jgi:3-oxoacyl-[acyl-carrier protein] reductase